MNSNIYFESERLLFRDWRQTDLAFLMSLNADPQVMRYFPSTLTDIQSEMLYEKIQQHFEHFGYGAYAVETKATNEMIGFIGFNYADFDAEFTPCVEILWRLHHRYWHQGYATEGAIACIEYASLYLHIPEIYSFTTCINQASESVMKKIGMKYQYDFAHPKLDPDDRLSQHVLYHMDLRS